MFFNQCVFFLINNKGWRRNKFLVTVWQPRKRGSWSWERVTSRHPPWNIFLAITTFKLRSVSIDASISIDANEVEIPYGFAITKN